MLALLVAAPLVLTGCMTASAATAMENQGAADDRAQQEWAADAVLMGIFGMEGTSNQGFEESPWGSEGSGEARNYFAKSADDRDVGDGRSEVWAYGYAAESKPGMLHVVFLDKDGDEVGTMTVPFDMDEEGLSPVGTYNVDSDEALSKAKDAEEGIAKGADAENHFVVMALMQSPDYENPVWSVVGGGGDSSGGGGGIAVIDAITGDVLFSWGGGSDGFGGF